MIIFKNGEPAYITKRFDINPEGVKLGKEDFATLAGKTVDTEGVDFKYEYSYEEAGQLIKKFIPAYKLEIEKFFGLVVFNRERRYKKLDKKHNRIVVIRDLFCY